MQRQECAYSRGQREETNGLRINGDPKAGKPGGKSARAGHPHASQRRTHEGRVPAAPPPAEVRLARGELIGYNGAGVGERVMRPLGPSGPGGKSELRRARWWVTPTGRKARESATENRPPMAPVRRGTGKGETVR